MKVQLIACLKEPTRTAPAEWPRLSLELSASPAIIGRDPGADVCLDESHVSRQHCELRRCDDAVVVRDLESKNGTYVNGRKVTQASLRPGDKLCVGGMDFVVEFRVAEPAP